MILEEILEALFDLVGDLLLDIVGSFSAEMLASVWPERGHKMQTLFGEELSGPRSPRGCL